MAEPLVSILIPCYNAAAWLGDALESALAQTWSPIEVIVVNDGSTDDSLDVARRFEPRGVTVIDQVNRGAASARNSALASATGAFLQFLDADDLLAPDKIATQVRLLQGRGPRIVASGRWARFRLDPAEAVFTAHPNSRDLRGVEFLQMHYEDGSMMHPAAWLVPRAVADRAGAWDERLSLNDDGEYFARVVLAAESIAYCEAARAFYRSDLSGSLSRRSDRAALESLFLACSLTTEHLLGADSSPRSRAAAAYAWKWTAFELYPRAPDLSRRAEARSAALGGSSRRLPAGGRFHAAARVLGWRLARRLFA